MDLIYCETRAEYDRAMAKLKAQFPNARFEDGSDEIHHHRFSIEFPSDVVDMDPYYLFILRERIATSSLNFNMMVRIDTERVKKLIDQLDAEINKNIPPGK